MTRAVWLTVLALSLLPLSVQAHLVPRPLRLNRVNRHLAGTVIDHTRNHGPDRRIWAPSLCQKRDLYVYLPPGYDPHKRYPLMIYLHGFQSDELSFLDDVVRPLDRAIVCGQLPPVIVAGPDGSIHGLDCLATAGTFFVNSRQGRFEDFIVEDVFTFLHKNYPIHADPKANVLLGVSMGGGAACRMVMKYPQRFGSAATLLPPLNFRWISCRGLYRDPFHPDCWDWREDFSTGKEVIARFYGVINIRLKRLVEPLYGRDNPQTAALISASNPIELLDSLNIGPKDLDLYVGYCGKDEFNIAAQVDSFLYRARQKGIVVESEFLPDGRHNVASALRLLPGMLLWLQPRLQPFSPQ